MMHVMFMSCRLDDEVQDDEVHCKGSVTKSDETRKWGSKLGRYCRGEGDKRIRTRPLLPQTCEISVDTQ